MSLLSRLERRFGRFAIPNLTVDSDRRAGGAVRRAAWRRGGIVARSHCSSIPAEVLSGEVWRLVTFLFTPPRRAIGRIFVCFTFMLLYLFGTTLEQQLGHVSLQRVSC